MTRTKPEVDTCRKLVVRFPEDVMEAFQVKVQKTRRSMNAQILYLIEEWLAEDLDTRQRLPSLKEPCNAL
jgi:hypothetical protein